MLIPLYQCYHGNDYIYLNYLYHNNDVLSISLIFNFLFINEINFNIQQILYFINNCINFIFIQYV